MQGIRLLHRKKDLTNTSWTCEAQCADFKASTAVVGSQKVMKVINGRCGQSQQCDADSVRELVNLCAFVQGQIPPILEGSSVSIQSPLCSHCTLSLLLSLLLGLPSPVEQLLCPAPHSPLTLLSFHIVHCVQSLSDKTLPLS